MNSPELSLIIDELRVRYVDAYLSILPLKYALYAIGMSEEEYYTIKARIKTEAVE